MNRTPQDFLALVGERTARRLERRRDAACGLWPDLRIAYVNPGWVLFGRRNGGGSSFPGRWCEGAPLIEAIGRPLRAFYEEHLRDVLAGGEPWSHEYECSSPDLHRRFRLRATRLGSGEALLLEHTRLLARPHDESVLPALAPHTELYVDEHGLLTQCIHCRRIRRLGPDENWDWVPHWVAHVPDNASGGLCTGCVARYYPELARAPA